MADWSFLTNHARVLLCIAHDPGVRLREIAARTGVTERYPVAHGVEPGLRTIGRGCGDSSVWCTANRSTLALASALGDLRNGHGGQLQIVMAIMNTQCQAPLVCVSMLCSPGPG